MITINPDGRYYSCDPHNEELMDSLHKTNGCPKCGGTWDACEISGPIAGTCLPKCSKCGFMHERN